MDRNTCAVERPRNQSLDGSDESSIVRIDDDELPVPEDGASMNSIASNRSLDAADVAFHDVADAYMEGHDIPCTFVLGPNVHPKNGDRVAIFRIPWSSIHDFVAFQWAKDSASDLRALRLSTDDGIGPRDRRKIFAASDIRPLAADEEEYYQFCYVSEDGEILGSSSTFQIFSENKDASSTTRTSLPGACKDCDVLKARVVQLEETLEARSVTTYEPLNQAMAEDLQKSRERIRELCDQEAALKDKLRAFDKEYDEVAQALEIVCGRAGGSPLAKISEVEKRIDELEGDRAVLRLLIHFATDIASSGEVSLEDGKFLPLRENEVAQLLNDKTQEVAMLRSVVEAKEAELFEVKNELRVEKANTDELLKAMSDEMEAKNRVLEGTIRDLQEQAKKNLEVIASVGMINHTRRDRVSQYLRDLGRDSKYSTLVREIGPTVIAILESQGNSTPKSPAKSLPSVASAEIKDVEKSEQKPGERPQSPAASAHPTENWETLSSVMDRSVSSQTSPVEPAPPSSKAPSISSSIVSHPSLIDRVVPLVTEQVGSLLKSAIENALNDAGAGPTEAFGDADESDFESVASHIVGEELEVIHAPEAETGEADTSPESTVEGNAPEDELGPTGVVPNAPEEAAEHTGPTPPENGTASADEPESSPSSTEDAGATRPSEEEGLVGEEEYVAYIPGMMRRQKPQVEKEEQSRAEEQPQQVEQQQPLHVEQAHQREPVFARPIDPARDFMRPMPPVGNAPPQFMAELEQARAAAINAAANGARAGAEASASGASDVAPTANAHATIGTNAAVAAAAAGAHAAGRAAEETAELTRRVVEGQRAHYEEEPERVQCPICSVPFAGNDAAGLNQHIDSYHLAMNCPMCGDEFPREAEEVFLDHVNRCLDRSGTPNGHTSAFARTFVTDWID